MNLEQQAQSVAARDRAAEALACGQPAMAEAHITEALRLDPGDADTRVIEARIRLALQQPLMALHALDAATFYDAAAGDRPDIVVLRLEALIAAGRDDAALAVAEQLIPSFPHDIRFHRYAAGICERLGRAREQVIHLTNLVALSPRDRQAGRTLARLLARENPQQAAALITAGHSLADSADQWQAARWSIDAGRYADAEATYRLLLAALPDDAALWIEAADHADRCGAHKLATKRYLKVIDLNGRHRFAALTSMARAAMHAGQFRAAVWWWWKATRLNASDVESWAALVVCGLSIDRPCLTDRAAARLESIASDDERDAALSRAWLHAVSGQIIDGATRPVEPAEEPASPLTWMLERSAAVLSQQSAKRPGWADTLYHTAVCRAALGDFLEAGECVQAALDINPLYKAATTLAARLPKSA